MTTHFPEKKTRVAARVALGCAFGLFTLGCQVHVALVPTRNWSHPAGEVPAETGADRVSVAARSDSTEKPRPRSPVNKQQPAAKPIGTSTAQSPSKPKTGEQIEAASSEPTGTIKMAAGSNDVTREPSESKIVPVQLQRTPSERVALLVPDGSPRNQQKLSDNKSPLPDAPEPKDDVYHVNLATVLRLAGASNLQIQLAAERVREAYARLDGAKVLWMPSLQAGVGYTKHEGRLQATQGQVLEVSRNALFVGGGGILSADALPLAGGGGGPARFTVDLSPVDIYFEPLAARQAAEASQAAEVSTFNDTFLEVVLAFLELQRAQWQVAIGEEAVRDADRLVDLTENFFRTGAGLKADALRAFAERADRQRRVLEAQERVGVVSAELARLLRLDPGVTLFAVAPIPVPVEIISDSIPLEDLIAQALSTRPELSHDQARMAETLYRMRREKWRPWLPNLHLGASAGGFGGGAGSHLGNFGGRSDFDALAIWELRNLGFGNRAAQRQQESLHRQAYLVYEQTTERIAAEVAQAYQQTQYRKRMIEQARLQVEAAQSALPLNFEGIRGRELRPIEAQQAIASLAAARGRYLQAVINYNRAQFRLLRALGESPDADTVQIDPMASGDNSPPAPAADDP